MSFWHSKPRTKRNAHAKDSVREWTNVWRFIFDDLWAGIFNIIFWHSCFEEFNRIDKTIACGISDSIFACNKLDEIDTINR